MPLPKEELKLISSEVELQLATVQMLFAYCPNCNHRNCENCNQLSFKGADISRFFPEGFDIKFFPPEMWEKVDQCCSCGLQNHVIEWLRKDWHPVAYEHAKPGANELPPMVKNQLLSMIEIDGVLAN
jgi:hypothetical protein